MEATLKGAVMKPEETRPNAEIPTSTMADVAFLLIIFFAITQTFAAQQGLDFSMPEEPEDSVVIEPVDSILVEVRPDSTLMADRKPVTPEQLLQYLDLKLRHNPKKPVILHPADEAPYGAMVETYDLLRGAGSHLGLEHEIQIALPTKAEVSQFW